MKNGCAETSARTLRVIPALCATTAVILSASAPVSAQTQTPLHGHYPPGQTGLRGAASPPAGWSFTSFSRLFSNLDVKDQTGSTAEHVGEARYANITMIGWTTDYKILGMNYGALIGIPFATGNLNPSGDELLSSRFALGDIIITPVALYGSSPSFDYQYQFSIWTPSGRFEPGGHENRGSGFWSLIYSAGAVWYPGGNRQGWSLSAVARLEQNFEQAHTGITPGANFDIDWGVGKIVRLGSLTFDIGAAGFATWQVTEQSGWPVVGNYRYFGIGPEISIAVAERWNVRVRAQWEFAARNAVQGNNIWFIVNYRI